MTKEFVFRTDMNIPLSFSFQYIFHDEKYNKPFFSTYLKTSMFLIFLLGFVFWTPWQESCCHRPNSHSYSVILHLKKNHEPYQLNL